MEISRPEHYYRVALERIRQAQYLYRESQSYALAIYVAGVAVESMLRAFRAKTTREFESRHDLSALFIESGMVQLGTDKLRAKGWSEDDIIRHTRTMRVAVNHVYMIWHNNYRFASEQRLLAHVKKMKLYRGLKGDILKANALHLIDAARVFIDKGVLQWD